MPLGPPPGGQSPLAARTACPPLAPERRASQCDGCVLYGALGAHKGLDLLARALILEPTQLRLVLAVGRPPEDLGRSRYGRTG
jgi:hypothetical protein